MRERIASALGPVTGLLVAGCLLVWYVGQPAADHRPTRMPEAQKVLSSQVPQAVLETTRTHRRPAPVARPVRVGRALATMRIPRFGADWEWTVLEGVAEWVIADGPGHYEGTALPGQRGNAAFAAHRAGHGDPFIDFDRLRPGDRVHLAQGRATWTYTITTAPRIVDVDDVWVLDPLPGRKLTLTTCWPKYGSARRMFVRAVLTDVAVSPEAG